MFCQEILRFYLWTTFHRGVKSHWYALPLRMPLTLWHFTAFVNQNCFSWLLVKQRQIQPCLSVQDLGTLIYIFLCWSWFGNFIYLEISYLENSPLLLLVYSSYSLSLSQTWKLFCISVNFKIQLLKQKSCSQLDFHYLLVLCYFQNSST